MSNKSFARIWSIVLALLLIATLVANYFAMKYSTIITRSLGHSTSKVVASTEPGDSEYFKSDFASHDELVAYQKEFSRQLVGEGVVLLRNDDNVLPLESGKKIASSASARPSSSTAVSAPVPSTPPSARA